MPIYVTMTDKFMSGWGGARDRIAKYVVICETRAQADAIERAAFERTEMRRVTMTDRRPYYRPGRYQVTFKSFHELGGPWLKYYQGE